MMSVLYYFFLHIEYSVIRLLQIHKFWLQNPLHVFVIYDTCALFTTISSLTENNYNYFPFYDWFDCKCPFFNYIVRFRLNFHWHGFSILLLSFSGVRRLVIVEAGSKRVQGIISLSDIFRFLLAWPRNTNNTPPAGRGGGDIVDLYKCKWSWIPTN